MKSTLSEIDRLDLAAQAQTANKFISRFLFISAFSAVFAFLAVFKHAFPKPAFAALFLIVDVAFVVLSLIDWRYRGYALAIVMLLFAVTEALELKQESHGQSSIGLYGYTLMFACWGISIWQRARIVAATYGDGWKSEHTQINSWLKVLQDFAVADIIAFSTGSFWSGYWSYRILHTSNCWVVAEYKKGGKIPFGIRIYPLDKVSFHELPNGDWTIKLAVPKKTLSNVAIAHNMPRSFEPYLQHAEA